MGLKLPNVTEVARQMWSMVIIRSVAPHGHPPGAMLWDDNNVAVKADRPFKYDRVLCVFVFQSPPPPPQAMARRSDVSTLVGLRLCGLRRWIPSLHCRSPRLNLPSTSPLGVAFGVADPKPSPCPCIVNSLR